MSYSSINQSLSLYIPRVFANITAERMTRVFEDLNFGYVSRVDLIQKENENGQSYNSAYVHFSEWFDNTSNRSFQERVLDPAREARIVYDDPWYWIVLENKGKKHNPGDRKPRIEISVGRQTLNHPLADISTMQLVSIDYVHKIENENQRLEFENYELRMQILATHGNRARSPSNESELNGMTPEWRRDYKMDVAEDE
jgi:hypothetical protein